MFKLLFLLIKQELLLQARQPRDHILSIAFFLIASLLLPLAIGPDIGLLSQMASGFIWILALLASMISLGSILEDDQRQGVIASLRLSPAPFSLYLLAKAFTHWLFSGLPLILLSPLLGLWLALPRPAFLPLMISLAMGTPALSMVGVMTAALSVDRPRQILLHIFLMLPLTIPILIFSTTIIEASLIGIVTLSHYIYLACLLIFSLIMMTIMGTIALK